MSTKNTLTGKVRFSYANVFEPKASEGDDREKYSVCIMIPKKDKATLEKIAAGIKEAAEYGAKSKWGGKQPKNLKLPLRDGDIDKADKPEFEGMYFVNASSNMAPGVIDANKNEIIQCSEFYSGCWGRALIHFYAFDTKGNKGVAVGLAAVQKLEDGDRLGGGGWSSDEFGDDDEFDPNSIM
jgi:hypothetical protein